MNDVVDGMCVSVALSPIVHILCQKFPVFYMCVCARYSSSYLPTYCGQTQVYSWANKGRTDTSHIAHCVLEQK